MRVKSRFLGVLVVTVSVLLLLAAGEGLAREFMSFLGGQAGGAHSAWTTVIAPMVTEQLPEVHVSAEASTGSPENVRRVNAGEAEMGVAFAVDLYRAWNGMEPFPSPLRNVRTASYLLSNVGHIVVLADSDIHEVEDLVGKRVAMGGPGSGSAISGELFFRAIGLWDKITPVYLGGLDASQALKDGKVDAYNWHTNLGNATFHDTAASHDIRFLDLDRPARESGFYDEHPYYVPDVVPGGIYRGVDVDTPTFSSPAYWIVRNDVPADLVQAMLEIVFSESGLQRIKNAVGAAGRSFGLDVGRLSVPVPLHDGAQRFWQEKGYSPSSMVQ